MDKSEWPCAVCGETKPTAQLRYRPIANRYECVDCIEDPRESAMDGSSVPVFVSAGLRRMVDDLEKQVERLQKERV